MKVGGILNIFRYIKDRKINIVFVFSIILIVNVVLFSTFTINIDNEDIIYMDILILFITIIYFSYDYFQWNKNYKNIYKDLKNNKDIEKVFMNGKIEEDIINLLIDNKNNIRIEDTNKLKKELSEINDYITKWIHEIKIPIAVLGLISDRIENIDEFEISNDLKIEIERLNFLVNQVLYTSRSTNFSEDLHIEEIDLYKIIMEVVKKNMNILISKNIELNIEKLDRKIYSDRKWVSYTIDQIINNSYKYIKDNGKIDIYFEENNDILILNIKDNGMGIPKKDIERIFDRGFTGDNGRKIGHSTGMGLYISSKMGEKVNYKLRAESRVNEYTNIKVVFDNINSYFNVLDR